MFRQKRDNPIVVHFFAPVNLEDPSDTIEYKWAEIGEDQDLIRHD